MRPDQPLSGEQVIELFSTARRRAVTLGDMWHERNQASLDLDEQVATNATLTDSQPYWSLYGQLEATARIAAREHKLQSREALQRLQSGLFERSVIVELLPDVPADAAFRLTGGTVGVLPEISHEGTAVDADLMLGTLTVDSLWVRMVDEIGTPLVTIKLKNE